MDYTGSPIWGGKYDAFAGIYAIRDIVGEPMLAYKAIHEAKVVAEVIAGHKAAFDTKTISNVAYTDPEIAGCA